MDPQEKFAMGVVELVNPKSSSENSNNPEADISDLLSTLKLCEAEIIQKAIFNYITESLVSKVEFLVTEYGQSSFSSIIPLLKHSKRLLLFNNSFTDRSDKFSSLLCKQLETLLQSCQNIEQLIQVLEVIEFLLAYNEKVSETFKRVKSQNLKKILVRFNESLEKIMNIFPEILFKFDLSLEVLGRIKDLDMQKHKLKLISQESFKEGRFGDKTQIIFQAFVPKKLVAPDLIDIKNLLKLAYVNPEHMQRAFDLLFDLIQDKSKKVNVELEKEFRLREDPDMKELSVLMKFALVSVQKPVTILKICQNNEAELALESENGKIFLVMKKQDHKAIREVVLSGIKENEWVSISYSHFQQAKGFLVTVNDKQFPDTLDLVRRLDRVSKLKLSFTGTLNYLAAFNKAQAKKELDPYKSNYSSLIESLTEKPELSSSILFLAGNEGEFLCRNHFEGLAQPHNIFEIFKQLGGINWMIPLFRQTTDSKNFVYLFKILKGFILSMEKNQITELFCTEFFQSLRVLMAQQISKPCLKMVKSMLEFIDAVNDPQVIKLAVEYIWFNREMWCKVNDHKIFIRAFDIIFKLDKEIFVLMFEEPTKVLELVKFFIEVNKDEQPFFSSYLFAIFYNVVDCFTKNLDVLIATIKMIVEKMRTEGEADHFRDFLRKVSDGWKDKSKRLKMEDMDYISLCDKIVDIVFPVFRSEDNCLACSVIGFILDVFSDNIYMYRKDPITQRVIDFKIEYSREKEFYIKLYRNLEEIHLDISKLDILDIFSKFSQKSVVKNIMKYNAPTTTSFLKVDQKGLFYFDIITNRLYEFYRTHLNEQYKFIDILKHIEIMIEENPRLGTKIVESSFFPEWSYNFFMNHNKEEISVFYDFFIKIFSRVQIFKTFDSLRKLIFYLQKEKKYHDGLEIYESIIKNEEFKEAAKVDQLILFETLNVFEDISFEYELREETIDIYTSITKILRDMCEIFDYSLSFPNVQSTIQLLRKVPETKPEKWIIYRDGGFIRQLLTFYFKIMRFRRDAQIEYLILCRLTKKNLKDKENDKEWKIIKSIMNKNTRNKNFNKTQEKIVIRSQIELKSPKKILSFNLLLYVYFEWSECIKTYEGSKKEESFKNFSQFVYDSEFIKKLKKENFKDYLKFYISDINETLRNKSEWAGKTKQFKYQVAFDDEVKQKSLESQIDVFINTIIKDGPKVIQENPLHFFVFYCTSLKIFAISKFYRVSISSSIKTEPREGSHHSKNDHIDSLPVYLNSSEVENKQNYKNMLMRYSDIFHKKDSTKSRFVLRNLRDSIGRCAFVHKSEKKYSNVVLAQRSSASSASVLSIATTCRKDSMDSIEHSVCTEEDVQLDMSFQRSGGEMASFDCELIKTYGTSAGTLTICKEFLLFESKPQVKTDFCPLVLDPKQKKKVFKASLLGVAPKLEDSSKLWPRGSVNEVVPKILMHVKSGIEFVFTSGKSKLFNFIDEFECTKVKRKLQQVGINVVNTLQAAKIAKKMWKKAELSNFEYLMKLNEYSGRSFNNLAQYPVFPWILKNFETDKLDLNDEENFRDLSLPIGAQEKQGQERCKNKFDVSQQEEKRGYHHGSHYSNGGIVLHYLLRIEPFTQQSKNLQGGNFDLPDRMFLALDLAWKSSQEYGGDCKEIVPELFYLPEIFCNKNRNEFGIRQNLEQVQGVYLPAWAKDSVYKFLQVHQKALESSLVSQNLPDWINLMFGCQQRGTEARSSFNLFHPVTYDDQYKTFLKEYDESFHFALSQQVLHFGQTPQKLFSKSHGGKKDSKSKDLLSDRLLRQEALKPIKIYSADVQALLISSSYVIVLSKNEENSLKILKFPLNDRLNEIREVEITQIKTPKRILACLLFDSILVICEKLSNCLFFYSITGEFRSKVRVSFSQITCIAGCSILAAGCSDSSLTLVKENNTKLQLFGHFEGIKDITVSERYFSVISCTTKAVLIHDYRSGNILNKIDVSGRKVLCNSFGLIFVKSLQSVEVFFMNGDHVRSILCDDNKKWGAFGDCVWYQKDLNTYVADPYYEDSPSVVSQSFSEARILRYNEKVDVAVWVVENDVYKLS